MEWIAVYAPRHINRKLTTLNSSSTPPSIGPRPQQLPPFQSGLQPMLLLPMRLRETDKEPVGFLILAVTHIAAQQLPKYAQS